MSASKAPTTINSSSSASSKVSWPTRSSFTRASSVGRMHGDEALLEFVMSPPAGLIDSTCELRCGAILLRWADELGYVASGSQGAVRMRGSDTRIPDVALLKRDTWDLLDDKTRNSFARVLSDAVVEVVSKTDLVVRVERTSVVVWLAGGHRFVLILDPMRKRVQSWVWRRRASHLPRRSSLRFCVENSYAPPGRAVDRLWISPTKRL